MGNRINPMELYDYDVHAWDIKKVLDQLEIKNAVLGGFSMGGSMQSGMFHCMMEPMFPSLLYLVQPPRFGHNAKIFHIIFQKVRLMT